MPHALIGTNHLRSYAGSEMVALELAEHLLSRGWRVDVYTNELGSPMVDELTGLPHDGRLRLVEASPAERFDESYDLVWSQHGVLPPTFVERLEEGVPSPIVWHHLSTFMDVEMPILADVESRVTALSTGFCAKALDTLEGFGLDRARTALYDNPAPDAFADHVREASQAGLSRVLVVSNHPPEEVRAAVEQLEARGIEVGRLGVHDRPVRVTPDVLAPYDAIVTIGKTVQFALSMGIPAYVYDHFGGVGWLDDEVLEAEADWAFSGRTTGRRIDADALVAELVDGFDAARAFAEQHRTRHAERWRLSTRVDALLADERLRPAPPAAASDVRRLAAFGRLYGDLYRLMRSRDRVATAATADLAESRAAHADAAAARDRRETEVLVIGQRLTAARADMHRAIDRADHAERAMQRAERRLARQQRLEEQRLGLVALLLSRPWSATSSARTFVGWLTRRSPIRFTDVRNADAVALRRMRAEVLESRFYRLGRVVGDDGGAGQQP
ncbi:glycosyltransferase [Agrococcus jejuensis]|uniref:glycosyltransferase n=1 Tax=Agrococcus jejuensis TaxID=399736 RepID=UPI0011A16D11|nr:glycosyltransferase [Agrococcus jejuensis]